MQVEEELSRQAAGRDTFLSIGVFDGVHLGHRHLLGHLKQRAETLSLTPGVVTFSRHPRSILQPESQVASLTSLAERLRLLREAGIELVVCLDFTSELAELEAEEFLALLQRQLRMKGLITGPDFALGRGRRGDVATLERLSRRMGFFLETVSPLWTNGVVVSSTAIRHALSRGEVGTVRQLLGRAYCLSGQVVSGEERGRTLSFPTANLAVPADLVLPADGVYATLTHRSQLALPSVTNIGVRPTFGSGERTVEVFLLDFQGELYGEVLVVELVERLREEKRFDTPEMLMNQIAEDVQRTRQILALKI